MTFMKLSHSSLKGKKGMTLLEVVVTLVVLLMLSGSLLWMLISGKTIWQASVNQAANRQELSAVIQDVNYRLSASNYGFTTVNTTGTPSSFGFLSARNSNNEFVTDSGGEADWQKVVVYYIPTGTTKLYRREVYGTFTTAPTAGELTTYANGDGKLLSSSISSMSATKNADGQTVDFSISIASKNKNGKTDSQTITTGIVPQN